MFCDWRFNKTPSHWERLESEIQFVITFDTSSLVASKCFHVFQHAYSLDFMHTLTILQKLSNASKHFPSTWTCRVAADSPRILLQWMMANGSRHMVALAS